MVEEGEFWVAVSDCFEPEKWLWDDKPSWRVARYWHRRCGDGVSPSNSGQIEACPAEISAFLREEKPSTEKVIFDTDIGGDPDDALALQYLLKEPRCELLGVTTVGKNAAKKAEVASALCRSLGREDVKIVPGGMDCAQPTDGTIRFQRVANAQDARFTDAAAAFMSRTIRDNPGEVTLLATAPFTNIAALFERDPEAVSLLKRLVVMGGNLDGTNYEWNAYTDVAAAKTVFEGMVGRAAPCTPSPPPELVMFGAEVTTPLSMSPDEGRAFMAKSPDFSFVRGDHAERWYGRCGRLYFHDPIAAVAIFHPEIAVCEPSRILVDENDRARTSCAPSGDSSNWTWRVATSVDYGRFLSEYLGVMADMREVSAIPRPLRLRVRQFPRPADATDRVPPPVLQFLSAVISI